MCQKLEGTLSRADRIRDVLYERRKRRTVASFFFCGVNSQQSVGVLLTLSQTANKSLFFRLTQNCCVLSKNIFNLYSSGKDVAKHTFSFSALQVAFNLYKCNHLNPLEVITLNWKITTLSLMYGTLRCCICY